MRPELIDPFVRSTCSVLGMMASIQPEIGEITERPSGHTWGAVTGVVAMVGARLTGNFSISFDKESALHVVGALLMTEMSELSPDVVDAVGEIANMVCGGAKVALHDLGYDFELATPMMITGENVSTSQLGKIPAIVVPLATEKGKFVLELVFREVSSPHG